jgi:hypothetical protein
MTQRATRLLALVALVGAAAWGCHSDPNVIVAPPTTPSLRPSGTPAPSASPLISPSPSPSVGLDGLAFRDDFMTSPLDTSRWNYHAQSGIIQVNKGVLDVLNAGAQKNFPYIVTRENIIPPVGAWFFETEYQYVSGGAWASICLDFLPNDEPNQKALTQPFMTTQQNDSDLKIAFDTESKPQSFTAPKGATAGTFHRLRVECDSNQTYNVLYDNVVLGTFSSKRRPQKFWIGANPPTDLTTAVNWPRIQFHYVAAGPLITSTIGDTAATSVSSTPAPIPK